MSTIGSRIRDRRIELGMSADELALRLGKNRATVYRYESDEIENFPVSVIGPLATVLDVSPAYLMGWDEPPKKDPADMVASEVIREIIQIISDFPADKLQSVADYVRFLSKSEET